MDFTLEVCGREMTVNIQFPELPGVFSSLVGQLWLCCQAHVSPPAQILEEVQVCRIGGAEAAGR